MSYCEQLFLKLTEWKKSVDKLEKAKSDYLGSFLDSDKQKYQETIQGVQKKESDYKKYKEEDCFIEVEPPYIQRLRFFGPDYEALKRIYESMQLKPFEVIIDTKIVGGRVTDINLSEWMGRQGLTSEEFLTALKNIKYFSKLESLRCRKNNLESLPELPSGLKILIIQRNKLKNLPNLPSGLEYLNCSENNIPELPKLPNGLKRLDAIGNMLKKVSALPNNLEECNLNGNDLAELPNLPSSLLKLYCSSNRIARLPDLPGGLLELSCKENELTELPQLPASLKRLGCYHNSLTDLPRLPDNIEEFSCERNPLSDETKKRIKQHKNAKNFKI